MSTTHQYFGNRTVTIVAAAGNATVNGDTERALWEFSIIRKLLRQNFNFLSILDFLRSLRLNSWLELQPNNLEELDEWRKISNAHSLAATTGKMVEKNTRKVTTTIRIQFYLWIYSIWCYRTDWQMYCASVNRPPPIRDCYFWSAAVLIFFSHDRHPSDGWNEPRYCVLIITYSVATHKYLNFQLIFVMKCESSVSRYRAASSSTFPSTHTHSFTN